MKSMVRRFVLVTLCVLMILPTICVSARDGYTTLYAENGKTMEVANEKVAEQLRVGWYTEPVQRLYAEGKSKVFPKSKVAKQLAVGWYTEPMQRLYAADGRSRVFPKSKVAEQLTVGWYTTPQYVDMYSLDGRKISVLKKNVEANKKVGWYTEPMAKLYAEGSRTLIVPLRKVSEYQNVGWYPLYKYMLSTHKTEIEKNYGPLRYIGNYEGTPNSDDFSKTYYANSPDSPIYIEQIGFNRNYGLYVSLKLSDVYPYLRLYADKNGRVSVENLKKIFGTNGLYGANYRRYGDTGYEKPQMMDNYCYILEDHMLGVTMKLDGRGFININDTGAWYYAF